MLTTEPFTTNGRTYSFGNSLRRTVSDISASRSTPYTSNDAHKSSHAKVISERLGHDSITTTMNIYGHALRSSDQAAADKFENLFILDAKQAKKDVGIIFLPASFSFMLSYFTFTYSFTAVLRQFIKSTSVIQISNTLYHPINPYISTGFSICFTPYKQRDIFNVCCMWEHIDRLHLNRLVPAFLQKTKITGQR